MRVVILGNGKWEAQPRFLKLLLKTDWIIACDGAYNRAIRIGLKPNALVGDFDSLDGRKPRHPGLVEVRFPAEKNATDGELALRLALARKPDEIMWYAALGNRWDQSVASLFLLSQAARRSVPVRLVQGGWDLYLVLKRLRLRGKPGDRISLLPLTPRVHGVSTEGLRYPLRGETLLQHRSRGVSNALVKSRCVIVVKGGWLIVAHEAGSTD